MLAVALQRHSNFDEKSLDVLRVKSIASDCTVHFPIAPYTFAVSL